MNTELFIKEITKPLNKELINPSFQFGLDGWDIDAGSPIVENGVCYLGDDGVIKQENILQDSGWYRITLTITPPRSDGPFDGTLSFELGDGAISFSSPQSYSQRIFIPTDSLKDLIIKGAGAVFPGLTWNGGITNISIEPIEGEYRQVDLYDDFDIPLNFSIAEIEDITKRNSSYSKTITIPSTENNNILFKNIYNLGEFDTYQFNNPVFCYINQMGSKVFEGSFQLTECQLLQEDKFYYEGVVYSDTTTLFTSMGDKLLKGNLNKGFDIDFSEYNHILNLINVRNSWTPTTSGGDYDGEKGVFYAPMNKFNKEKSDYYNIFRTDEMTPCLYIKEIWDKILNKYGFSYDSDFLNSEYFKSLVYPFTDTYMKFTAEDMNSQIFRAQGGGRWDLDLFTSDPSDDNQIIYAGTPAQGDWDVIEIDAAEFVVSKYNPTINGASFDINFRYDYDIYIRTAYQYASDWNLFVQQISEFNYEVRLVKLNADSTYTILGSEAGSINLNGVYEMDSTGEVSTGQFSKEPIIQGTLDVETSINIATNEKIFMWVRMFAEQRNNFGEWVYLRPSVPDEVNVSFVMMATTSIPTNFDFINTDNYWNIDMLDKKYDGSLIRVNDILHQVPQKDFILSIIKMFNLYIEPKDDDENTLIIEPREDYFDLNSDIKDWSDKVYNNLPIKISKGADLIDKTLNFKYVYDENNLNKRYVDEFVYEYGEYYRINNKNKGEELNIELIFGISPQQKMKLNSKIELPSLYKLDDNGDFVNTFNFKPRIMFHKNFAYHNTSELFIVRPSFSHSPNYTYSGQYPYIGHFDDLVFNSNATQDLSFDKNRRYFIDYNNIDSVLTNRFYGEMISNYLDHNTKIVKMFLELNPIDIENFKFNDLIFIDKYYYRVNKIFNYLPNKPTEVELIRLADVDFEIGEWKTSFTVIKAPFTPDLNINEENYINLIDSNQLQSVIKLGLIDPSGLESDYFIDLIDSNITDISEISNIKQINFGKINK